MDTGLSSNKRRERPRDDRLSTLMEREAAKKSKWSVFSNLHSEHSIRFDY